MLIFYLLKIILILVKLELNKLESIYKMLSTMFQKGHKKCLL